MKHIGLCRNSVARNINVKSNECLNNKFYMKFKFQGVNVELQTKICFVKNLGQNIVVKFTKLSKISFSTECFRAYFSEFPGTIV